MWQEIWNTVVAEFSDIPDAAQVTRITLRLLVAAMLGGLLGYERERQGKSAGVRTHMLVAIGAALFVLIPQQAGASSADLSRVLQGLIAGVGFLGAGAIIMGTKDVETRGLTTAAGIWVTAAIGMAAGMGRESTAVLSTVIALLVLSVVPSVFRTKKRLKSNGLGRARLSGKIWHLVRLRHAVLPLLTILTISNSVQLRSPNIAPAK